MSNWLGRVLIGGAAVVSSVASAQLVSENRAQAVPDRPLLDIDIDADENDEGVQPRPMANDFTVTIPQRPVVANPAHV